MSLEILHDPRVRATEHRDLHGMGAAQTALELLMGVPFVLGSWACAARGWWLASLGLAFVFFLVGLRLVHDAFHRNLGLSRAGHDVVLVVMSVLMGAAMHAIQFNHLRHHAHCMDDEDVEAFGARLPAHKALLYGPYFPWLLHRHAFLHGGPRVRRFLALELGLWLALVALALALTLPLLRFHLGVMLVGQCLTAFFAVWTVHHDCDRSHYIALTIRGRVKSVLTFNMFYHVEHHLFPRVPTYRLPELARRLDQRAPELSTRRVF